ncbi:toxic anion resistance protein [Candidatus Soleaferrea massiliensis]|uniref:toxic anion resistance protein n=1 Tax=Candidatus Soleaferrea massiliensis TaxID=1470354 RepID=UPI00059142D4|nr:toxic anion resistance protein [Candidatus Soleaferrea massiliensis]
MALQFTPSSGGSGQTTAEPAEVESFDLVQKRDQMAKQLEGSKEVDALVSKITLDDPNSILYFGNDAATEISKCSDAVLSNVNMQQLSSSSQMLTHLKKIMDQFDLEEIAEEEKTGFFQKMFNSAQKKLEQILAKYHTMGDEVDKIYLQLKTYESEINDSNKTLEQMFQTNLDYYQLLVKYILAGEQGLKEIDTYLADLNQKFEQTQDNMLKFDINNLEQGKMLLEQRVQDLRIAENVAMQSIPMIKAMQFSNMNLIRKINSAFIITMPIFKQALTQAILLKRQRLQTQAMQALDDKTNEMLIKNAENTALQTKLTAQLASGSSVKIETLEKTWRTIVNGIDETQRIQEEASAKRKQDAERLEKIKEEYKAKMNA